MASTKISDLTSASSVAAADLFTLVQSGVNKKVTAPVMFGGGVVGQMPVYASGGLIGPSLVLFTDETNKKVRISSGDGTASHRVDVHHDGGSGYITSSTGPIVARGEGGIALEIRRSSDNARIGYFDNSNELHIAGIAEVALLKCSNGLLGLSYYGEGSLFGTIYSTPISPTVLSADVDDWSPGRSRTYRVTTSGGARTINGLVAGVDGEERFVHNANAVGGDNVLLGDQKGTSTAANRFSLPGGADKTIAPQETVRIWYDATDSRWKV